MRRADWPSTAVAAAASGGATMAPSAIAAAIGSPASRPADQRDGGRGQHDGDDAPATRAAAIAPESRGEVSNAASSSTGATNSASARSGSISIVGANGTKASAGAGERQQGGIGNLEPPRDAGQEHGAEQEHERPFEEGHAPC